MMTFEYSQNYAKDVGDHFGQYRTSFVSDNAQVVAHVFEEAGDLVAYISISPGLTQESITDAYLSPLNQYADREGFGGRLKLRYT